MNLEDRIAAFEKLGKYLGAIDEVTFSDLVLRARNQNAWFTEANIRTAFHGLCRLLEPMALRAWVEKYELPKQQPRPRKVGVVMAGNLPLVGFHDLLCVLISGHHILIKFSSKDRTLPGFIIEKLIEIQPAFGDAIRPVDLLRDFDAVIATGSDNSARYFEYYFAKYPHIIRRNRTSCAILTGFESREELEALGADVFTYFGLGCRNVSKLYVPAGYEFTPLIEAWQKYAEVMNHHKYHNNYDYQKSILLVNREHFLEGGFVLFQESEKLVSPISVVYYEYYEDWNAVLGQLRSNRDKIQCVVGNVDAASVPIGQAQLPGPADYADGIDTMEFLKSL